MDDLFDAVAAVNHLLDKPLLDGDHAVVWHLGRIVAEKSVHHKIKQLVNLQVIPFHMLAAVGHHEII